MNKNKIQPRFKEPEKRIGRVADEWAESLWDALIDRITKTKTKSEVKGILENLISEDEKKTALRRLAILALVREGKSYREIGEILWVSPQTISTVKKNAAGNHKNYKSYLAFYGGPKYRSVEINVKKPRWEDLFKNIDLWEIIKNPPRPPGIGIKGN